MPKKQLDQWLQLKVKSAHLYAFDVRFSQDFNINLYSPTSGRIKHNIKKNIITHNHKCINASKAAKRTSRVLYMQV